MIRSASMLHFLIVYDRPAGRLVRFQEYTDTDYALAARDCLEEERAHWNDPRWEIVVLSASTREALRTTHGRYFLPPLEGMRRAIADPEAPSADG